MLRKIGILLYIVPLPAKYKMGLSNSSDPRSSAGQGRIACTRNGSNYMTIRARARDHANGQAMRRVL